MRKLIPSIIIIVIFTVMFVFVQLKNLKTVNIQENKVTKIVPESQRELNGFMIGQHDSVLENEFGKPYKIINQDDGDQVYIYPINVKDNSYMAFYIDSPKDRIIHQIQITGNKNTEMNPFLNLRLGDSKEKVMQTLGQPYKIEKQPNNSDLYIYDNRNYTLEVNNNNLLSSIKIEWYQGFKDDSNTFSWDDFVSTLNSNKLDLISELIMPDIEITKGNDVYKIEKRFNKEISDPKSNILKYLLFDKDSVKNVLANYKGKINQSIRITEANQNGWVIKFINNSILDEIFFRYEAGKWRAWEIRYKN